MAIDYQKILADLKDAVVVPVTAAAKDLLAANKPAAEFLEGRAKRVAELGLEYVKAKTDEDRAAALELLEVVKQSIQNQLAAVAVNASAASRETFQKVLATALDVAIKMLPILISAI